MSNLQQAGNSNTISTELGVVASLPRPGEENIIMVHLPERFTDSQGILELAPEQMTVSGKDLRGRSYTTKVSVPQYIEATYMGDEANRITAPQVQIGERIQIIRLANDKTWYWKPLNQDMHSRIQETVVSAYAAKPNKGNETTTEPTTAENSITQTMDGANGLVEIRMPQANGEVSKWLFQMNGKDGTMNISDQQGNFIQINTVQSTIDIKNQAGSFVQLVKDTINISAPKTINIKAGDTLNIDAPKINIKSDTISGQASSSYTMKSPTINEDGTVNVGTLNTGLSGASGNSSVKGSMDIQGSTAIKGSLSASGSVSFPAGGSAGHIRGSGD